MTFRGPARVLASAHLVNSIGDGAFYVSSVLFFSRVVGLSVLEIGIGLTVGWAVGTHPRVPVRPKRMVTAGRQN
ncbi:hypothetical protein [Pseudonocardia pini]|uniref:hypothetical protein n=1 Tax=Pseudonocardia pini TaxID=2758030 RepID=UPI0015F011A9|nr:hypothetical protein [Pseudonocardia pini]